MGMGIPGGLEAENLIMGGLVAMSSSNSSVSALAWPSASDCITKLNLVVPVAPDADLLADVQNVLNAVISEFQGPVGHAAEGCGTGRQFGTVTEQRVFDGTGYAKLVVDDLDPSQAVTVNVYGTTLSDVVVQQNRHGLGANTLVRQFANGFSYIFMAQELPYGIFPSGEQNVFVTASWGNPFSYDIVEAIKCEVAYRLLVQGYVDLAGVGETVTLGSYTNATASGISVWKNSSPIAVFHKIYQQCVERYRDNGGWRRTRLKPAMS